MTSWRHNICLDCWNRKHPGTPPAKPNFHPEPDTCCFCRQSNSDGIYIRHDPQTLPCRGVHPDR